MGAARIAILSLALIAAIGLAVVVRNMMVAKRPPVAVAAARPIATPMTRVLVAKRDLPVGARITQTDIGWQTWPVDGLNPLFITENAKPAPAPTTAIGKAADGAAVVAQEIYGTGAIDSLVGTIVHDPILAGEPIQPGKLVHGGEGGYLAVVLAPGMQALGVPVKTESSAGGFILPGDRVDVLQSKEIDAPGGQTRIRVTDPVVVNVRVLAIDQATKPSGASNSIVGAVATLEVKPDAAEALVEAIAQGDLHLALRSYADISAPSGVARPRTRRGQETTQTVKIFSQGETTEVAVTR